MVIVGGINLDIGRRLRGELAATGFNPGQVRISLGSMGRNITHNMALVGLDARMLTTFGDDTNTQHIVASCDELGVDISQCLTMSDRVISTYLLITDGCGDMALAIGDTEIYEHVTSAFLVGRTRPFQDAQLLVIDTNTPAQSIAWLAGSIRLPISTGPMSTAKAKKPRPVLGKLHVLKPNRLKAELLSGVPITDVASFDAAADILLTTGLWRVFIGLGDGGMFAVDYSEQVHVSCCSGGIVDAIDYGDAGVTVIARAYLESTGLEDAARAVMTAGAITMGSAEMINPGMSVWLLHQRAGFGRGVETS